MGWFTPCKSLTTEMASSVADICSLDSGAFSTVSVYEEYNRVMKIISLHNEPIIHDIPYELILTGILKT